MKRLKLHHIEVEHQLGNGFIWYRVPHAHSTTFKKFSTKQEKAFYFLHKIECKDYPVKLRAKRGKNLVDAHDDIPTCFNDVTRSWKHNSKRSHQWYKEKSQ